jgi:hypothetical protein
VYVQPQVTRFVRERFIPVRIHVQRQPDQFRKLGRRYNASWTPTILVLDEHGEERHRIEGFLPAEDFLPQLKLGAAHAAFAAEAYERAETAYRGIVESFPTSDAAPEALYWAGVSRYKATGDPAALAETATQFTHRYQDSAWAKKSSVWQR